MRYFIQSTTANEVARLAVVASGIFQDDGARLVKVCDLSSHLWLAADSRGAPDALFGVAPFRDDPFVGQFWVFYLGDGDDERDRRYALRLVVEEMSSHYDWLENWVDERKLYLLALLKSAGFSIGPAENRLSGARCHHVLRRGVGSQLAAQAS